MKKKKMIIIGTLGIIALTSAIVIPIVVINNNDKKDKTDVEAVVKLLKNKNTQERTIILPVDSIGKIIDNKKLIILKIKELIKNSKYDDVKIDVLVKNNDTTIHYLKKEIIVKLTKGKTTKQLKEIWVQRERNLIEEDIFSIKTILDVKTGNDLIISLSDNTISNIIGKATNKNAIEKELRKLINPSNADGAINHVSLKGVTITISMNVDSPISTSPQNIIITISKAGGASIRTTKTFQVKRNQKVSEINADINAIKTILDVKIGNDLIISLSDNTIGNIIGKVINKNAIEKELRKLINPSNADGAINHVSLKGVTITISMNADSPISTSPQNIIVTISKAGGASIRTTKTFQVKRNQKVSEINADINAIKTILDVKIGNDLIISLSDNTIGNIIGKVINKNAIEKELRKLIDPSNTDGAINHASLKGVTIMISMNADSPISTSPQNIIVTISKAGGVSIRTTKTFQVKRLETSAEQKTFFDKVVLKIEDKNRDIWLPPRTTSGGNSVLAEKNRIKLLFFKKINSQLSIVNKLTNDEKLIIIFKKSSRTVQKHEWTDLSLLIKKETYEKVIRFRVQYMS